MRWDRGILHDTSCFFACYREFDSWRFTDWSGSVSSALIDVRLATTREESQWIDPWANGCVWKWGTPTSIKLPWFSLASEYASQWNCGTVLRSPLDTWMWTTSNGYLVWSVWTYFWCLLQCAEPKLSSNRIFSIAHVWLIFGEAGWSWDVPILRETQLKSSWLALESLLNVARRDCSFKCWGRWGWDCSCGPSIVHPIFVHALRYCNHLVRHVFTNVALLPLCGHH